MLVMVSMMVVRGHPTGYIDEDSNVAATGKLYKNPIYRQTGVFTLQAAQRVN